MERTGKDRRQHECTLPNKDEHSRCEFAEAAAEKAVRKVFAILGVDIDKPEQVKDFQESLMFGDKLRKAADRGTIVFVSCLIAALFAALCLGLKTRITGP